jgi:hypothetical protein
MTGFLTPRVAWRLGQAAGCGVGWEFLEVGWQGDAHRLKQLAGDAGGRGAQQEALVIRNPPPRAALCSAD